jgi:hypothetical protein
MIAYDKIPEKYIKLFFEKIDKSQECWLWTASTTDDGYGKYTVRLGKESRTFRSTRLSFFLNYGYIDDTLLVCHTCDNPLCVNPKHLFLGTVKENNMDCITKGRQRHAKWENKSTLLKNDDVIEIKKLIKSGVSQIDIAKMFNVGKNCIWFIANGITWKGIE